MIDLSVKLTPARNFRIRASGSWFVAIATAFVLNLVLLALLPGLIARPTHAPITLETPHSVNVVRPRRVETPPMKEEKKAPAPEEAPSPESLRPRSPIQPSPGKRIMPFEFAPELPVIGPGDMTLPPLEGFDLSEFPGEFGEYDIDAPLTALSQTPPFYPIQARRRGLQGRVVVRYVVNEQGTVDNVRIVDAEPPDIFDESVIRAVSSWRFAPGAIQGVAVRTRAEAEFFFGSELDR